MWWYNIKIAVRNLIKGRIQTMILVGGLTIGMATCILLLQYVNHHLSFDRFNDNGENIYRVINARYQGDELVQYGTITYPTVGQGFKEQIPEVINNTRLTYSGSVVINFDDEILAVEDALWPDEQFLKLFDYKLLAREDELLLDQSNQVVISSNLAETSFGRTTPGDIIGKEIHIDRYPDPFRIVGVAENPPLNSHLHFDLLISYASAIRYWGEGADNSRTWSDFYHYLLLDEAADLREVEAKMTAFADDHFSEALSTGRSEKFELQPLYDAHMYSRDIEYEIGEITNARNVWALVIIAFFILMIAWINYLNLTSVRAMERSVEVGVRKVVGASRSQLMRQFLSEAFLINFISLILAIFLSQWMAPLFAQKLGVNVTIFNLTEVSFLYGYLLLVFLAMLVLGVFISGFYPALLLSSTILTSVLKGTFSHSSKGKNLRKSLVVVQFAIAIGLISTTWMVSHQINFLNDQDLGLNIDQVVMINPPLMSEFDSTFINRMNTLKKELVKHPAISSATATSRAPGERMSRIFDLRATNAQGEASYASNSLYVDYNYAETFEIELAAGRFFRENDHNYDFNQVDKVVINEHLSSMLGYPSAADAVSHSIKISDRDWQIIGVTEDFHQRSLHHAIEPIALIPSYSQYNQLAVKASPENMEGTISRIKNTYTTIFPGNEFSYYFADESFADLYQSDQIFKSVLLFFTIVIVCIACLGLFALSSYMTLMRAKEIGIRKILGASVSNIVMLLSKDFLWLVLLSTIVSIPLAVLVLKSWLAGFSEQVALAWWIFAGTTVTALLLGIITVALQTLKFAVANPRDSIRND